MDEERAIILMLDDAEKRVSFNDYVIAKHKALREFGYGDLTLETVINSANKVLKGEGEEISDVISMMMEGEIKEGDNGA